MRLCVGVGLALLAAGCGSQGPASLVFVEITPAQPRLGDITTVKFAATDSRGMPAEGIVVDFELQREAGGVTLAPRQSSTNQGSGEVITQLTASGRVASVVVVARAGDKVAQSPPITFAGSAVSARGITFQCGPVAGLGSGGIRAINAFGRTRELIAGVKLDCSAHVADRNGDGIPGALVSFLTEAGTIGPLAESVSDGIGNATILYKTSFPLPEDVLPGSYTHTPVESTTQIGQHLAPEWMSPWRWQANPMDATLPLPDPSCPGGCDEPRRADPVRPNRVNNPRDNLVAMIAVTTGEEAFVDLNNNGVYDDGEPYVDTTEPFVDSNDNGTWDAGELYIDTDGSGFWDGKNGVYDAATLIWAQNRILWTGVPNDYDYDETRPANPPQGYLPTIKRLLPLNTNVVNIPHLGLQAVRFRIADPWFNTFAQNGSSDGCFARGSSAVNIVPEVFGWSGIRFDYPSVDDVQMVITDAHEPEQGGTPPPPPSAYVVDMYCRGTASPNEGHQLEFYVGGVGGTAN